MKQFTSDLEGRIERPQSQELRNWSSGLFSGFGARMWMEGSSMALCDGHGQEGRGHG